MRTCLCATVKVSSQVQQSVVVVVLIVENWFSPSVDSYVSSGKVNVNEKKRKGFVTEYFRGPVVLW